MFYLFVGFVPKLLRHCECCVVLLIILLLFSETYVVGNPTYARPFYFGI